MTNISSDHEQRRGNPWRLPVWGAVAGLLLLPLVAMRFTSEVNWTTTDFVFAGVVLGLAAVGWEVAAWKLQSTRSRVVAALGILGMVLLVWAWAVA